MEGCQYTRREGRRNRQRSGKGREAREKGRERREKDALKSINKFPHPLLCLTGNVIIQLTLFVGLLFSFEKYPTKLARAVDEDVVGEEVDSVTT
jgi:hypothetical protein